MGNQKFITNSLYSLLILVLCAFVFSSCTRKPEAMISVGQTELGVGDTTVFYSKAIRTFHHSWDMGDGTVFTECACAEVYHAYADTGIYLVTYTAFSKGKRRTDETTVSITVQ